MNDEMIDFIAKRTYDYYAAQNTNTSYTDSLHAELARVKTATDNLIRAMEAGSFNDATKVRMEELDAQRSDLEAALAEVDAARGVHGLSGMGHHVVADCVSFATTFSKGETRNETQIFIADPGRSHGGIACRL